MASVSKDPSGRYRVQFDAPDGKRKTLRLPTGDGKVARSVATHVEHLLSSRITGSPIPQATAIWLATVREPLRSRIARAGLIEARDSVPLLGAWCRQYLAGRHDLAPRSVARLEHAARLMAEFFGADRPIDRITPADAEAFSRWPGLGRAANTTRRRVGWAKQFLCAAIRAGILSHNPFEGLAANTRPDRSRDHFVDLDTLDKLLDACPDAEWRAILSLARIGGLRCPSEVLALEWGHVLWDRDRLVVPCIKTAATTGESHRVLPLFPRLRQALEELDALAAEGARFVISSRYRSSDRSLRAHLAGICRRAGVASFSKPFINMRASRATELVEEFPSHVCAAWLGHSEKIADAHYRQVHEQHYSRATQNPTLRVPEGSCASVQSPQGDPPQELAVSGFRTIPQYCSFVHSVNKNTFSVSASDSPSSRVNSQAEVET